MTFIHSSPALSYTRLLTTALILYKENCVRQEYMPGRRTPANLEETYVDTVKAYICVVLSNSGGLVFAFALFPCEVRACLAQWCHEGTLLTHWQRCLTRGERYQQLQTECITVWSAVYSKNKSPVMSWGEIHHQCSENNDQWTSEDTRKIQIDGRSSIKLQRGLGSASHLSTTWRKESWLWWWCSHASVQLRRRWETWTTGM